MEEGDALASVGGYALGRLLEQLGVVRGDFDVVGRLREAGLNVGRGVGGGERGLGVEDGDDDLDLDDELAEDSQGEDQEGDQDDQDKRDKSNQDSASDHDDPLDASDGSSDDSSDPSHSSDSLDPPINDIFPDYAPKAILNFTQLFAARQTRRTRLHLPKTARQRFRWETRKPKRACHLTGVDLVGEVRDGGKKEAPKTVESRRDSGRLHHHHHRLDDFSTTYWEGQVIWTGKEPRGRARPLDIRAPLPDRGGGGGGGGGGDDEEIPGIVWHAEPGRGRVAAALVPSPSSRLRDAGERDRAIAALGKDVYNISNDQHYLTLRRAQRRVRQTLANLEVQHSWPAQKLQLPLFKINLTKSEARSFHRPAIQFPTNVQISLSRLRKDRKGLKEKKVRMRKEAAGDSLHHTRDLSHRDGSQIVLLEFSEEHPPILPNVGMGSLIVNYYRKRQLKDDHIPRLDLGEPVILDIGDESPFMKFGLVDRGQTVQTLYNNLIRAPIFTHKTSPTDFLLIRSSHSGQIDYFLRSIDTIHVVGQTLPVSAVPGPHARRTTNTAKYRLMSIALKLIRKNGKGRVKMAKLARYFPEHTEMQLRQRLKEFLVYERRPGGVGFWRIKPGYPMPSEEELRKLIPPEHVSLYESMQVGQRHLMDAGYGRSADRDDETNDDSHLDVEQQLAPWITTKNFMNAALGKAMLRLHGAGDPTGRGEGLSFIRISMKDVFLRAEDDTEERRMELESGKSGHRYNIAEQQRVYRQEIERVWKDQAAALANPEAPPLDDEPAPTPQEEDDAMSVDEAPATPAAAAAAAAAPTPSESKVLKIRRLRRGIWETEVVRDAAVIAAYVRRRRKIEEETTDAETLIPTDDAEKNAFMKRRIQEQLTKLKRNQERRLARKQIRGELPTDGGELDVDGSAGVENGTTTTGGGGGGGKVETARRCGNCGQKGHVKTNRIRCPRYGEFYGEHAVPGAIPWSAIHGVNVSAAARATAQAAQTRLERGDEMRS